MDRWIKNFELRIKPLGCDLTNFMSFMSTCHLKGTVRKHKHYQQPLEHKNAPNYCFSKNLNETMYHIERNILLFVCLKVSVIVKQQETFIQLLKMH